MFQKALTIRMNLFGENDSNVKNLKKEISKYIL